MCRDESEARRRYAETTERLLYVAIGFDIGIAVVIILSSLTR
jgi:hypothetical protein